MMEIQGTGLEDSLRDQHFPTFDRREKEDTRTSSSKGVRVRRGHAADACPCY